MLKSGAIFPTSISGGGTGAAATGGVALVCASAAEAQVTVAAKAANSENLPAFMFRPLRVRLKVCRFFESNQCGGRAMQLRGIHHLTAVSASIRENLRFYTGAMGMRLVKRSVNQDDVSAYHLFYADAAGSPGTDLTFFDWNMPAERRGTHSITRTFLRVNGLDTLKWWAGRFDDLGVTHSGVAERDGRACLDFEDGEGQRLALVDDSGRGDDPSPWSQSPVPEEHQIRGLGPIVMSVPDLRPTDTVLTRVMEMRHAREYQEGGEYPHAVHVYEMFEGGPHAELHVAVQPQMERARLGAGGVHH